MTDYIKREDAIRAVHKLVRTNEVQHAEDLVNAIPSADAVSVVRCKACKYFLDNLTDNDTDEVYGECRFDWDIQMPQPDDYCSYGKRKE